MLDSEYEKIGYDVGAKVISQRDSLHNSGERRNMQAKKKEAEIILAVYYYRLYRFYAR